MSSKRIENILVPTDFSELSVNALTTAIAMCKRQNATLHILHVVENRFLVAPPEAAMGPIHLIREGEETGKLRLAQLEKEIKELYFNNNIVTHLGTGNPAEGIRDSAIELNCDIIVMGTHGASGFRELFMGSNAYNVIKNTMIPVLTIPGKRTITDFKRILFPIRATQGIINKYDFLEPIIEKNHAEIIIAGLSMPGEAYSLDPMNEEIRELGKSLRINNTKFKSDFFVCKNYAKKVLDIAKKEKADLIVINASLDYKWQEFLVGPYTQQVINHSSVPVLSIRTLNPKVIFAESVKDGIRNATYNNLSS